MIKRLIAASLIVSVIISGCSVYRDYSFEYYERSGPRGKLVFNMKDSSVYPVATSQIAMVKNTQDHYAIYFKEGQPLILKKDQIDSVRMYDRRRDVAMGLVVFFGTITLSIVGILVLLDNANW